MNSFKPVKQIGVGELELGSGEKEYLHQVVDSNRLSYGPFSQKFEKLFAELHDCRFAIFCSSGTAALQLALTALKEKYGWQDGDEVIIPSVTFISTSNIVLHSNMRPVFVDVDPKTYNIDAKLIEDKITPRTRAIIPVHLLGLPCEMNPILGLAKKHNLRIIEDSCETMFASYEGKKVGSFGDVGCFSTYIAHFIVAGIGGVVTTSDPDLAITMRSLMNHGRDNIYISIDDDKNVSKEKLSQIVSRRFSFIRLGYNFRATELEAAIGLAQLENKDFIIKKRRDNALYFIEHLKDLEEFIQLPYMPSDRDHVFMLFPIVLKDRPKKKLIDFLEENLIETRDLMPLLNQPIYKKIFGDIEDKYPVAKHLTQSAFYIGCHQYLTEDEKAYIVDKFHEFFAKN